MTYMSFLPTWLSSGTHIIVSLFEIMMIFECMVKLVDMGDGYYSMRLILSGIFV